MKKIHILPYILILSLTLAVFLCTPASAVSDPPVSSRAAVLIDTATGNVLYAKSPDDKAFPASTTKIMTVLLAIEALEEGKVALEDRVTASTNIMQGLTEDGSSAGIVPGETMSLEDLLYCTMLSSANEACNVIAEHVSGDVASFVALMNQRAVQLGCTGTNFTNTHGLPDANHYTTARDLGLISLEAFSHPLFMEIANTVQKTIPATNVAGERQLSNTNGLINEDSEIYGSYFYEYAKGIKTGHTNDAGYCLVSSAEKDGVSLLAVVLGGSSSSADARKNLTNFLDTKALYQWAFENFAYRNILEPRELVEDLPIKMSRDTDFVSLCPQTPVRALMPKDEDKSDFEQQVIIYSRQTGEELVAPLEAGTVLGEISISRDGIVYGSSKLVAASSVDVSYSLLIRSKIVQTLKSPIVIIIILILAALLTLYVFLLVRYHQSKREYLRRMRERGGQQKAPRMRETPKLQEKPRQEKVLTAGGGARKAAPEKPAPSPEQEAELQAERDYFAEFFGKKE